MCGDLPVQKGASSSPNSYELFSKSVVSFFETILNVNNKALGNIKFFLAEIHIQEEVNLSLKASNAVFLAIMK